MKQVQFAEYGGPEVLHYQDAPDLTPAQGQVLVKVEAAGVNFADLMRRADVYVEHSPLPYILGMEAAGTIAAVGPGVDHLAPGTPVLAILGDGGAYAQYALASADGVVVLPPGVGAGESTALVVQGLTAYLVLTQTAPLQPGQTVLVHAAAGGVGTIAIQLAKLLGAGTVIATASTEAKLALARSLGADIGINYQHDDWPRQILAATDGRGADIVLESVGGEIFARSFEVLAPFGHLVSFGAADGAAARLDITALFGPNHTISGFYLIGWFTRGSAVPDALNQLLTWVARGDLKIPEVTSFPLERAADAHRAIQTRQTTGKVVLTPRS
jgi:NADPH2:quinone reductase